MPDGHAGGAAPACHDVLSLLKTRGAARQLEWPHARRLLAGLALAAWAVLLGCDRPTGPIEVSYLAIVALVDTPPGVSAGARYGYRVREVSGTLGIDTTLDVAPADTVILRLPVATYDVALTGLPAWCDSRYGADQFVVVFDPPSTALARYYITCRAPLTVHVSNEGPAPPDPEIVYRLLGDGGASRVGILHPGDTLRFDNLPAGAYEFALSVIAVNCVVISDGGARPQVVVPQGGGAVLDVRISCSDPARRPQFLSAAATHRDGVSAFIARIADPDRDVERYVWDVTDCAGTSVLSGGARIRRGLSAGRTRELDSMTVLGAFETGLSAAEVAGRCTALRFEDQYGNTTPVVELPIRAAAGSAPQATMFNAFTIGTTAIHTDLGVADEDGDFVGVFAAARLRDGVLAAPDGTPDIGIYTVAGYLGAQIPDLTLGSRIQYGDVYAVILYLIDAAGHVTRLEDGDPFR